MAVITYSKKKNGNTKLSANFMVKEFACKDGDRILIDMALVDKLEKLRAELKCTKMVVNSGYRTAKHDKAVGGSGKGQHTKGKAADIKCYDINGVIISSKIVTCAAQDLGFGGISNIDETYTSCHVDIRPDAKWYGDETVTSLYSITDNFYKHWGLTQNDIYKTSFLPSPSPMPESVSVTITINGTVYKGRLTQTDS